MEQVARTLTMSADDSTASTAVATIPIAALQAIYSVTDVDRKIEDQATSRNEHLKGWYDRMRQLGGSRYIIKPTSTTGLDPLYGSCPNFADVIGDIRKYLALAISGNEPIQFTPVLLLGEPGLGKTHFAKSLARALATGFEFVPMNSLTAGWILTGASSQWQNAKPGKIASTLIEGDYANPVVVLDEVDKAGGDHRYDPLGALYTLLEQDTAAHFKDEYIEVDIDASHILWVATANDESQIPEPILNRMNVYTVERPDEEGSRRIALSVYQALLDQHNWPFPPEPADSVLDRLAEIPPRDMKKLLLDAFGNARLAGRDHLVPEDIELQKLCGRRAKMGF